MQNQKITINNNKQINPIRPFSSQKYYHNALISLNNTYNKLNNKKTIKKIPIKNHKDITDSNEKIINSNNIFYDNLSENILNLYDFEDTVKAENDQDKFFVKLYNKRSNKYYKSNISRDPYQSYIMNHKNRKNEINKNKNVSEIRENNPLFKKININKRNKINERKQSILKNRNIINYISPKINNFSNHYDFTKINNYLSDKNFKYNKIFSNYKHKFIERNSYNINQSPVGRFDQYFFDNNNSNYKYDKRKQINNQILITNSINKDLNKRLRIESPTSLSYHSYIKKNSPKEMSIEHNIEYDIHNFNNKNKSNCKREEMNKKKVNNIPFNEKDKLKLKTDKINNFYNMLNCNNFKSVTINKLIQDLYSKNNDNDNNNENSKNTSNLDNNNTNIHYNKTDNTNKIKVLKENNNNNYKVNQKNNNNNPNNKSMINKKIKQIITNDNIEIIIEYNNDNNIQKLILNDKKGKKINFVPKNISYKTNNSNTTDISSNNNNKISDINNIKNCSLKTSVPKTIKMLKKSINKKNKRGNKSYLESSEILKIRSKEIFFGNKLNDEPENAHSINITSPNNDIKSNHNIKRRIPINNSNKTNKYFMSSKI